MSRIIDTKYDIGDIVYLATDELQLPRIVTAITLRGSFLTYEISCGRCTPSWHMDCEMAIEKNVLGVLSI